MMEQLSNKLRKKVNVKSIPVYPCRVRAPIPEPVTTPASSGCDLLGSIMMTQDILHMKSDNFTIKRDGKLGYQEGWNLMASCKTDVAAPVALGPFSVSYSE